MILFISMILCGIICSLIGSKKGEGVSGFIVGCLLGPLGIIIALFTKGNRIKCSSCKELINQDVTKCPKCTYDVVV